MPADVGHHAASKFLVHRILAANEPISEKVEDGGGFDSVSFLHHAEEMPFEHFLVKEVLIRCGHLFGWHNRLVDEIVPQTLGLQEHSVPPIVDALRNHVVFIVAEGLALELLVELLFVHQEIFGYVFT